MWTNMQQYNSVTMLTEFVHLLLMMIFVHILWREYKEILFMILLLMLGYETFVYNEFSIFFVPIVSIGCYLGELLFLYAHDYPWRYDNQGMVPLWKLPLWGILGIHIARLSKVDIKI